MVKSWCEEFYTQLSMVDVFFSVYRKRRKASRRLALMFVCAHPAIEPGIRAPLMLQVVLGLDAKAIASAFLMSPATMGKRLVRAKDKIRQAAIPFSVPDRQQLPGRVEAVLGAIYTAFTEGWADPGGTDIVRRDPTDEAFFLARLVAELLPQQPEVLGLLALMLHVEGRRGARRNAQGEYVPLADRGVSTRLDQRALRLTAVPVSKPPEGSHGSHLGVPQLQPDKVVQHTTKAQSGNSVRLEP